MTAGSGASLLGPDDAARVAESFREAGFTVDGIATAFGDAVVHTINATDAAARAARGDLEQDSSPLGLIVRLFLLGQSIDEARVAAVVPSAAALLERRGSTAGSRYDISPYGDEGHDWWVVSDRTDDHGRPMRPDHVLGVGGAATTLAQITVRRQVGRALDVGTGCGVQALHLSTHAAAVTATDVVPHALDLAATTAALSGVSFETLGGDLTEPVADRRFDLVVCNPPFVVGPAARYAYRDGVTDWSATTTGDGFGRRVVRECADVLDDGGVAQLLVNWLHVRGEDWRDRVSGWVSDLGCDAWLIERDVSDPLDYVRTWAVDAGEGDDVALAHRWLSWFRARDVEAIGFGWVVLRRSRGPHRVAVETATQQVLQPVSEGIASWLDSTKWLRHRSNDDLLAHAFTTAADVRLDTAATVGVAGWEPVSNSFAIDSGFRWSLPTDDGTAALVAACDGTRPLHAIVSVLELTIDADPVELRSACCAAVRGLIDRGVLRP